MRKGSRRGRGFDAAFAKAARSVFADDLVELIDVISGGRPHVKRQIERMRAEGFHYDAKLDEFTKIVRSADLKRKMALRVPAAQVMAEADAFGSMMRLIAERERRFTGAEAKPR